MTITRCDGCGAEKANHPLANALDGWLHGGLGAPQVDWCTQCVAKMRQALSLQGGQDR